MFSFLSLKKISTEKAKEAFVAVLFAVIAVAAVWYSSLLPFSVNPDNYTTLLANKAAKDESYPDREMILRMDFKPYLYTNLLDVLSPRFPFRTYEMAMLGFLVFAAGYAAYFSLRYIGFSRLVAVSTAIVFLPPRIGLGGSTFGILTRNELLGRAFALPFLWLLAAWFIRRKREGKSLVPVFAAAGIVSYIHPVSTIFFSGALFLVYGIEILLEGINRQKIFDFVFSIFAFCVSALFLLVKIVSTTKYISIGKDDFAPATGSEYAKALLYRMGFDFPPGNMVWLRNTFVVTAFFLVAAVVALFAVRKKIFMPASFEYETARFGILFVLVSVFVSIFLPFTQLFMIVHYDWPLIIQQTARFFVHYFFGLYLLFAVALAFAEKISIKKTALVFTLAVIGFFSSSFGLEWAEILAGYPHYSPSHIPIVLQGNKDFSSSDETQTTPLICEDMARAGIKKGDLVVAENFFLRYYCETHLYSTHTEGTAYMMSGKNEAAYRYRRQTDQIRALTGKAEDMDAFAKKVKADYAVLMPESPLAREYKDAGRVLYASLRVSIIRFNEDTP